MEFQNPVLPGMHPDPTICRVGRDFYLACSSFEYFPGVPIYHSRDLVEWRQIGNVLTRRSQLDVSTVPSSGGIYAPTLRHHDGVFFLVTTLIGRGHFVVTANDPHGPWSDPIWLDDDGIDPSLAFLDGRIYYTRNGPGTDPDHPFVYQGELDDSLRIAVEPRVVWKGLGGVWPEGPHLYRRGDWLYLLTAEGGTSFDHSVVVTRSRAPYGPFKPSPHGPLVTHRDKPRHPIQALGHADLVDLEDGSTWVVLLGIRPLGRRHHLGRETFLAPVSWGDDGWPRMDGVELRMDGPPLPRSPRRAPPKAAFGRRLGPEWVFVRNPVRGSWSLRERPGSLRLHGLAGGLADVAPLAGVFRRQEALAVSARTQLVFEPRTEGEQAGLCLRASEEFYGAVVVAQGASGRELRLERRIGGHPAVLGRCDLGPGPVTLELRASAHQYVFSGGTGELEELGRIPTSAFAAEAILERTGRHHFTGALLGLFATGGGQPATVPADFLELDLRSDGD